MRLTVQDGDITGFKLKIPGIPTYSFQGGRPNPQTINLIEKMATRSLLQLFAIETDLSSFDNRSIQIEDL